MKKYLISFVAISLTCLSVGRAEAQLAFWNYDDADHATVIPTECDGVLDETRGGVFLPSPEEMRVQGEKFLLEKNPLERNKAGYCLIAAALQGDVLAQYRVAQLYNKGIVLPQDELSAYKWAFIASLGGNKEADKLALLLERFLTTEDIELATASVQELIPNINNKYKNELDIQNKKVEEKREKLEEVNQEIDSILGIKTKRVVKKSKKESATMPSEEDIKSVVPSGSVFSEEDRL